jgi:four helix bundle protein
MTREEMKSRTKAYANRVVKLCRSLPGDWVAKTLDMQLLRSGTSIGANYRAVCRAKSTPDFLNKLKIVEEECDESIFWMELLVENNLVSARRLKNLMQKGDELPCDCRVLRKSHAHNGFGALIMNSNHFSHNPVRLRCDVDA